MNAVRRIADYFVDSPTFGRDRAALISGFSIGTASLLLNFAVLMLAMPVLMDPDDPSFRAMTENLEFGNLLALMLLGGASAFATLLIPLRLVSVFWGPRTGRYFDQIVLSGISPLRFVIGKAVSQNLFVALIVFLLLPYLVLSLTLGGVDLPTFAAGLFVVWLYCIALAMVTLWLTVYFNELLAAFLVAVGATILAIVGAIPTTTMPVFVMTPIPLLLQPVYATMSGGFPLAGFWPVFGTTVATLVGVVGLSAFAIQLGPLYGIIQENSTFGEVVRQGDSQRKRWFRLRLHIQRPSELAFFYENRSALFRRHEGLLRWALGFVGLVLLSLVFTVWLLRSQALRAAGVAPHWYWFAYSFHMLCLMIHGFGLAAAVLLFSHPKNTTFLRVPLMFGWTVEVARLDTLCFLLFAAYSSAAAFATPYVFDQMIADLVNNTVFAATGQIDFVRLSSEGTLILTVAGLVLYAFQRLVCLSSWMKGAVFAGVCLFYLFIICIVPLTVGAVLFDMPEFRGTTVATEWAPRVMILSPIVAIMSMFREMGPRWPADFSTAGFYLSHLALLVLAAFGIGHRSRKVRAQYPAEPVREER